MTHYRKPTAADIGKMVEVRSPEFDWQSGMADTQDLKQRPACWQLVDEP